jgi:hypothetical protein
VTDRMICPYCGERKHPAEKKEDREHILAEEAARFAESDRTLTRSERP